MFCLTTHEENLFQIIIMKLEKDLLTFCMIIMTFTHQKSSPQIIFENEFSILCRKKSPTISLNLYYALMKVTKSNSKIKWILFCYSFYL